VTELFEVLITRAASRTPDRKRQGAYQLDLSRWQALLGSDPTLLPIDSVPGRNPMTGEHMTVQTPNSAAWAHPRGLLARFIWRDGELQATAVDQLTVDKAKQIAAALDAHVFVDVD
jgi:hypothetical protein